MIPKDAKRIKNRPLALGEITGHHHSFVCDEADVEMYEKDGQTYVRIVGEVAPLTHQEHKGHVAPRGAEGDIRIAEEVTDWGTRPVLD